MTAPTACPSREEGPLTWDDARFGFDYIDGRHWRLQHDFHFHYDGAAAAAARRESDPEHFAPRASDNLHLHGVVAAGFETDFHSIPRFFYRVAHPFEYGQAAVIHDHLYRKGSGVTRAEADEIYAAALDKCGCPEWRRDVMFRALRMFGMFAFKKR